MWKILTRQPQLVRYLLRADYEELLYPFDDPDSRFTRKNIPPILCITLPHLTEHYEALFDDLEPIVRSFPRQSPANHCRSLFEWLCERFDRKVWVERSGGSSMYTSRLMYRFPEAKIINMYRDGRDTAISMFNHHPFRGLAVYILALQERGYDLLKAEANQSELWDSMALRLQPLKYLLHFPTPMPADELRVEHFGKLWSQMVEVSQSFLQHYPSERILNVRFEDLQQNPEREARRIVCFMSPDLDNEHWVREASKIPRPTQSKFERLRPEERAIVDRGLPTGPRAARLLRVVV